MGAGSWELGGATGGSNWVQVSKLVSGGTVEDLMSYPRGVGKFIDSCKDVGQGGRQK